MLPTTGHFKDIGCPFLENSCDRPYCHFRHKRKNTENEPSDSSKQVSSAPEIPVYKPTPKSELLANPRSHIPIRYVPDLAERSTSRKPASYQLPTYKPTPLSVLSNVNKAENASLRSTDYSVCPETSAFLEKYADFKSTEYNPSEPLSSEPSNINFEELSTEFDLIDEIISDTAVDEAETPENCSVVNKCDKKEKSEVRKTKNKREKVKKPSEYVSSKHKDRDRSKHDKSKSEEKIKTVRKSSHKRESSQKSKHKSKDSKRRRKSESESDIKDKTHKRKSTDKLKSEKPRQKPEPTKQLPDSDADNIGSDDDLNLDPFLEDDTMEECFRIFNEYKPEEQKQLVEEEQQTVSTNSELPNFSKKRVAHQNAEKTPSKTSHAPPKTITNAAQAMTNRFKAARISQANNEQRDIMEELKQTLKRPPSTSLTSLRPKQTRLEPQKPTSSKTKLVYTHQKVEAQRISIVEGILMAKNKPLRIAPAQNVDSIQRAKLKIEIAKQNAAAKRTPLQTVAKGAKRVAHVPEFSLSDIPDVLQADKSKLPVNVRTRYLTLLGDECCKLYLAKNDAYQRALNEEFKCYERCKVLVTYRNSAMLSINRLRKEIQEREAAGLGPIGAGETGKQEKVSQLKGRKFYDNIKPYLLSEDELIANGYPRESQIPGRATIKTQKTSASTLPLEENERICTRCSKLYLVNDAGFALYPEDCIYHPLKKRTLRGERTYLCCKSTEDVGCATSHTHVSENFLDSELVGYQTTMDPEHEDDSRSYAVYALDCEMCYTIRGLELTRVTIVDVDCKTVYESLVKPLNPIIDYNTRFSGITKEQMDRTSTSILQVQANILHLCNSKTILIGHSLESDMKALKIIHSNVIDTAILFPHKMGLPHKRALRALASDYLRKIIQNDVCGHDSAEDALTCMQLVLWKVKEELKVRGVKL